MGIRPRGRKRLGEKGETIRELTAGLLGVQWARGSFCYGESTAAIVGAEDDDDGICGVPGHPALRESGRRTKAMRQIPRARRGSEREAVATLVAIGGDDGARDRAGESAEERGGVQGECERVGGGRGSSISNQAARGKKQACRRWRGAAKHASGMRPGLLARG